MDAVQADAGGVSKEEGPRPNQAGDLLDNSLSPALTLRRGHTLTYLNRDRSGLASLS